MRERGIGDIPLFGGGIIPDEDIPELKAAGVDEIFTPGTPIETIISYIRKRLGQSETIAS
jgi:Methylmalonyl-CoA mutase, C-terminal domain/subunit (cobalamin-binding)